MNFKAKLLNLSVNYEMQRKYATKVSWMVASILIVLVLYPLMNLALEVLWNFVLLPAHAYHLMNSFFYSSQFVLAALSLRDRFKALNNYLRFVCKKLFLFLINDVSADH